MTDDAEPAQPIAELAALLAEPARARMLTALMGGIALTATELALAAGVSPSTASAHLARLASGGLLAIEKQGRHRYFRIARLEIAELVEGLSSIEQPQRPPRRPSGPADPALRVARVCYDHLAGERAVWLFDQLRERRLLGGRDGCDVTAAGETFFAGLGLDLAALARARRSFSRPCLDWSERRHHLGGALGAALLDRLFALRWARRDLTGRAVHFTPAGERAFRTTFGGDPQEPATPSGRRA